MKFLLTLLLIVVAMALRDFLGTQLTIYQSRGEAEKAGRMDGLGDIVSMIYTITGVDTLNKAGFSLQGVVMLLLIAFTSYRTTKWATKRMFKEAK